MYIKALSCISSQCTFDNRFQQGEIQSFSGNQYSAVEPDYTAVIPSNLLRRMGKAVRMGVGTSLPILDQQDVLDGIIIGTANGGLEDCIKFLNQIVKYEEGTLTPTNFVQSTPNALAGLLAMMMKNTGYNATHINKGLAFETAVLDALLFMEEEKDSSLLLGAIEEISTYNYNIERLSGVFKETPVHSSELLISKTKGTVIGEGATMFIVGNEREGALAELVDVGQISHPSTEELEGLLIRFLDRNNISISDVDGVVLGNSGDSQTDFWYSALADKYFPNRARYVYKHLVGDYPTVSAFALWLSVHILDGIKIPETIIQEEGKHSPKTILIYNHYRGKQHGFMVVRKP